MSDVNELRPHQRAALGELGRVHGTRTARGEVDIGYRSTGCFCEYCTAFERAAALEHSYEQLRTKTAEQPGGPIPQDTLQRWRRAAEIHAPLYTEGRTTGQVVIALLDEIDRLNRAVQHALTGSIERGFSDAQERAALARIARAWGDATALACRVRGSIGDHADLSPRPPASELQAATEALLLLLDEIERLKAASTPRASPP